MKRLVFTFNQEVLIFDIHNKEIHYRDRKWPQGIKFIPKDEGLVKMIIFSRNKISNQLITWINDANSGKNLAEWEACEDDEAVAKVVIRDATMRGCILRKQFNEEDLKNIGNIPDAMLDKIPLEFPKDKENLLIEDKNINNQSRDNTLEEN